MEEGNIIDGFDETCKDGNDPYNLAHQSVRRSEKWPLLGPTAPKIHVGPRHSIGLTCPMGMVDFRCFSGAVYIYIYIPISGRSCYVEVLCGSCSQPPVSSQSPLVYSFVQMSVRHSQLQANLEEHKTLEENKTSCDRNQNTTRNEEQ